MAAPHKLFDLTGSGDAEGLRRAAPPIGQSLRSALCARKSHPSTRAGAARNRPRRRRRSTVCRRQHTQKIIIPLPSQHSNNYLICVITRCAETGRVPPASGVIVRAVELPAGLRMVSVELRADVFTKDIPT